MADTSGFVTGDDFIGFDFELPAAGSSRATSPASSLVSDSRNLLDGLTRSPPSRWRGSGRDTDGVKSETVATAAPNVSTSAQGTKRKSDVVPLPDSKRPKNDSFTTGPRNLKEQKKAAERAAPWADNVEWDRCVDSSEMLNDEIHAFYHYMTPTVAESRVRAQMIDLIANTIMDQWGDAEVMPFGSWQTGLYLPTGDIDLVVTTARLTEKTKIRLLREMAGMMRRAQITQDVAVISRAKVPIIKFVTTDGNINVDISLNHPSTVSNGVQAAKIIQHYLDDLPGSRELILVVKAFLSQRSMNEVYTGGLGSYSVICLVISFLQLHPKLRRSEMDARRNLGTLLCEFFELYGRNFNYDNVGISIRRGGSYYSKARRGWGNFNNQPFLLSIEDPQDADNDIARSSHGIRQVKMTLGGAYDLLTATLFERTNLISSRRHGDNHEPLDPQDVSILATVMGVTKETQKFRRELVSLDTSGRLNNKLSNLLAGMGHRAMIVSRDTQQAEDGHTIESRKGATNGDTDAYQVRVQRTPPPPCRGDDPVNAIIVDDSDDGSTPMSLDSDSDSDGSHNVSRARRHSPLPPTVGSSRFASVSADSTEEDEHNAKEEGEISDSKYTTHSKGRKRNEARTTARRTREQLAMNGDGGSSSSEASGINGAEKEAPPPIKASAGGSNGQAAKRMARAAARKAQSAPGSKAPSVAGDDDDYGLTPGELSSASAPPGPEEGWATGLRRRASAADRKAFWAAKAYVRDESDGDV